MWKLPRRSSLIALMFVLFAMGASSSHAYSAEQTVTASTSGLTPVDMKYTLYEWVSVGGQPAQWVQVGTARQDLPHTSTVNLGMGMGYCIYSKTLTGLTVGVNYAVIAEKKTGPTTYVYVSTMYWLQN